MDWKDIAVQGIGFLGTGLFFASYQFKKNKTLFRVQFLSYMFYTVHLFLLGATTGAVSYILNTARSLCLGSSNRFLKSNAMCAIICVLQFAALALTWSGWVSILPVAANIAATIAGYTFNPRKIRIAAMFINSPLWIVYDIFVRSWAGILDEAITEIAVIISIIRFGWKNLDKTDSELNSKNK